MSEPASADIKQAYKTTAEMAFVIAQALSQIKDERVIDEVVARLLKDCDN
ncbi:hypothetical protein [Fischerella sp. PCC 9605]|nr:hypothetical protein [Fischerella sp. PCC 9605]